jgi:hypothetical protein
MYHHADSSLTADLVLLDVTMKYARMLTDPSAPMLY